MVRRRVLTSSARQASMNAYQQLWHQQELARGALVASMPEYWHSVCNRMGGAMPRMAVIAPPEVSSRKLSCLRRQLMKAPSETVAMHSFIPNYGLQQHPQVQFQRGYQSTGNRSCPSQSVSKAALLKPGCILAACQNQCFRNLPAAAVGVAPTHPPQQHFTQGNLFDYPGAVSPMQWQQQQYQVQQQHKQFLLQQQQKAVPVGILKNSSRVGVAQHFGGDYQTSSALKTKRVTIKSTAATRSGYQEPVVEQIKLKPAVPPKPSRRVKQSTLKKERQQLQQLQLQHELLKQHQTVQNQKDQQKLQQQQLLQHQKDLGKQQQHQKSQQQLDQCTSFNFGKFANHFIEGCSRDSDTETSMYTAANSEIKPEKQQKAQQLKSSKSRGLSCKESKQESIKEPQVKPEKSEVCNREGKTSSRRFLDRQARKLESENDSSTVTLTAEQNRSKTQYQSRTSLTDKATNTKGDPLDDLLKPGPQKAESATSATSRKLNINELLRNEKVKGLDGNPMWHSLMQLVAHMCEAKESDKGDKEQQSSRLSAGFGADGLQKQYSVYLMVTSDEEDEDSASGKPKVEQSSSDPKLSNNKGIIGEDQFAKRCDDVYQAEHPKLGRRRRTRKRLNPRLRDLSIPYPSTQTQLPMRRPLHWPKPDYSKSQGRSSRTRNPSRVRSRSSTKQAVNLRSQRSLSSALDEKRSWRLWQDLPMTARTLNKAYSRMLTL